MSHKAFQDYYPEVTAAAAAGAGDEGAFGDLVSRHRDAIVNLIEVQANATTFDGGVFIASCDKAMPAMLMSIGRLKEMSAIMVTGGVMEAFTLPPEYKEDDPGCAINQLLGEMSALPLKAVRTYSSTVGCIPIQLRSRTSIPSYTGLLSRSIL